MFAGVGESIRIAISACLLGKEVRFDGGHKRDPFLVETFGRYVEWVPVCPEVEVGMGTPREAVRLVQVGGKVRMLGRTSRIDWTERMESCARDRAHALRDVHGAVFKKDSPTCGLLRVKLYPDRDGVAPSRGGRGLFGAAFVRAHPLVPAEEEGRLNDAELRESFVERVFAYRRLRTLLDAPPRIDRWMAFHAAHKYQLLAHSPEGYRELGRVVAAADPARIDEYAALFMQTLARPATKSRQCNVLQHILGHFKKYLSAEDKEEALQHIEDYRKGIVPLLVPLTLLEHFQRQHPDEWLGRQTYFAPHPKELMLRTHL